MRLAENEVVAALGIGRAGSRMSCESHEPVNEGWLDVPGPSGRAAMPGEHSKKKKQWKVLLAIMGQIEQRKVGEANA